MFNFDKTFRIDFIKLLFKLKPTKFTRKRFKNLIGVKLYNIDTIPSKINL